jgi:hypothetical protein
MPDVRTTLTLGLLSAALLAGCGGADLDLDIDVDAPEASDYPQAAEQVCEDVSAGFAEAQRETPRSFDQAEELMTALVGVAGDGQELLDEVEAPGDRAQAYERYLQARAEALALLEDGLAATREEDGQAYEDARRALAEGAAERRRLALAAGLSGCAAAERS